MLTFIGRALNVREGEWRLLLPLFCFMLISAAALQNAEVVATALFLSQLGVEELPLLWAGTSAAAILVSYFFSKIESRCAPFALLQGMTVFCCVSLALIRLMFGLNVSPAISNSALYITVFLQLWFVTFAFWAVANAVCNVAAGQRLFPLIYAGFVIGSTLGNWGAATFLPVLTSQGLRNIDFLIVDCLALGACSILVATSFPRTPKAPRAARDRNSTSDLKICLEFFRNVPVFRTLVVTSFLSWVVMQLVPFYLFSTATKVMADDTQIQAMYGNLKAATCLVAFLTQIFVSNRLSGKLGMRNIFFLFPATLLMGGIVAILRLDLLLVALAWYFAAGVIQNAFEVPARLGLMALVPDARRGALSLFHYHYVPAAGMLVGNVLLYIIVLQLRAGTYPTSSITIGYLAIAVGLSSVALFLVFQIRKNYTPNLLSWPLARRKRPVSAELQ